MEKPQLNTIVEFGSQKIKVLFSHENRRVHATMVPVLKEFLSHELGQEVEVVSRFTAWETFYTATDNVFDLVILAENYAARDLTSQDLIKKIKQIDQSTPVVQFSSKNECATEQTDGCYPLPKSRQELRPLTHFFRNHNRNRKRS